MLETMEKEHEDTSSDGTAKVILCSSDVIGTPVATNGEGGTMLKGWSKIAEHRDNEGR